MHLDARTMTQQDCQRTFVFLDGVEVPEVLVADDEAGYVLVQVLERREEDGRTVLVTDLLREPDPAQAEETLDLSVQQPGEIRLIVQRRRGQVRIEQR